jgi:hypothetical protein
VRDWFIRHPRIAGALWLALGLPVVVAAGLGATLLVGLAVQTWLLPPDAPLSPLLWVGGFVLTCIPLWLLVGRCIRLGGMPGVALGLGILVVVAIGLSALGCLEQLLEPQNGMAGIGEVILMIILGLFAAVALGMALLARVLRRA